ncbi:MAG: RluA family pseudouridine synthase [Candidatus Bipolaricaulota bacterium]|nr:RluA family pseudouridine synthase [Candidatus Bipolaricaulota bacterium]
MIRIFYVSPEGAGERLDRWLAAQCARTGLEQLTRSQIQALCAAGAVRVNNRTVRAAAVLHPGDCVEITVPDDLLQKPEAKIAPEPFTLSILYEDAALLVIDKPAGMVVHPAAGHLKGTVVHQLLARGPLSTVGGAERPGIVHRLDEGTSGVLVIAKTDEAHRNLIEQFKNRAVEKIYIALVHGVVTEDEGRIEGPIGRDPADRQRMRILPSGKPAITEFRVLKRFSQETLLEVRPLTGRMHQIRVHLRAIGHPVVGDALYGSKKPKESAGTGRMMLHAWQIALAHPITQEPLRVIAPWPPEFASLSSDLLESDPTVIEQREIRQPDAHIEQHKRDLAPEEKSQNTQGDQGRCGFSEEARLDDDPAPIPKTQR